MLKLFLPIIFCFCTSFVIAQNQFWFDDFEGTSSSSGTRTPENNGGVGGPPFTSYFCRTPANGTVSQSVPFTGYQGTNYWAGEDHDAAGTGFAGAGTSAMSVRQQDITWTGINISGKVGLSLKCLLAANSTNQPFDNRNACSGGATTNTDYVILQYSIDAGPYNDMLRFFTNGALTGKYLYQETTGDSCGDGTQLLNVFHEFSGNIVGTGTSLSLRLLVYSEGGNEEWGIDNIRLFTSTTLPVTFTGFSGKTEALANVLSWSTAAELNNKRFEVQRSNSGREPDFVTIGTVEGLGNSSTGHEYTFEDKNISTPTAYYRLKQMDMDGGFKYSAIVILTRDDNEQLRLYPNPVTDILTIEYRKPDANVKQLVLLDAAGRKLPLKSSRVGTAFNFNISGLTKGIYYVRLTTADAILIRRITKL